MLIIHHCLRSRFTFYNTHIIVLGYRRSNTGQSGERERVVANILAGVADGERRAPSDEPQQFPNGKLHPYLNN